MNAPFDSDNLNWAAEFGRELAKEVKEHIARVVKPLQNRIAQLEARGEMKYCGLWEEGREYLRGNFTTTNGGLRFLPSLDLRRFE